MTKVNLKQLSESLGLSQTTVSRALNGYPEVKEATRLKVQDAARRMNYAPNPGARGLATGRSMAIGHVIPVSKRHEMVNPIFGDFVAGASQTYSQRGYDMVLTHVDDGDEESVYRMLASKGPAFERILLCLAKPFHPLIPKGAFLFVAPLDNVQELGGIWCPVFEEDVVVAFGFQKASHIPT